MEVVRFENESLLHIRVYLTQLLLLRLLLPSSDLRLQPPFDHNQSIIQREAKSRVQRLGRRSLQFRKFPYPIACSY